MKEEEARRSREDRDQLTRRWTSWTIRPEVTTEETDVICEQPLLKFSKGSIILRGGSMHYLQGELLMGTVGWVR